MKQTFYYYDPKNRSVDLHSMNIICVIYIGILSYFFFEFQIVNAAHLFCPNGRDTCKINIDFNYIVEKKYKNILTIRFNSNRTITTISIQIAICYQNMSAVKTKNNEKYGFRGKTI